MRALSALAAEIAPAADPCVNGGAATRAIGAVKPSATKANGNKRRNMGVPQPALGCSTTSLKHGHRQQSPWRAAPCCEREDTRPIVFRADHHAAVPLCLAPERRSRARPSAKNCTFAWL